MSAVLSSDLCLIEQLAKGPGHWFEQETEQEFGELCTLLKLKCLLMPCTDILHAFVLGLSPSFVG